MATSEPLVPTDQPYGERQRFVEAAQSAEMPLDTPAVAGSPVTPLPPSPAGRPQQPGIVPPNFDVLADREPADLGGSTAVTQMDLWRQQLLNHPNPLYRDLAHRILS